MGQYHYVVNLTKKEFLYPHKFGDGLKLLEFGMSANGTMTALAVLLSNSRNRGGGDLCSDDEEWYGRWAGDNIVIAGDYAEPGDAAEPMEGGNICSLCRDGYYTDISENIIRVIEAAGEKIRKKA